MRKVLRKREQEQEQTALKPAMDGSYEEALREIADAFRDAYPNTAAPDRVAVPLGV